MRGVEHSNTRLMAGKVVQIITVKEMDHFFG